LALIFEKIGKDFQAEKYLTSAVLSENTAIEAWSCLGKIYNKKSDFEKAAECFATAAELEQSTPVIPFHKIRRYV